MKSRHKLKQHIPNQLPHLLSDLLNLVSPSPSILSHLPIPCCQRKRGYSIVLQPSLKMDPEQSEDEAREGKPGGVVEDFGERAEEGSEFCSELAEARGESVRWWRGWVRGEGTDLEFRVLGLMGRTRHRLVRRVGRGRRSCSRGR